MKLIIIIYALLLLCTVGFADEIGPYPKSTEEIRKLFLSWVGEHGKEYPTGAEMYRRFKTFVHNVRYINDLNQQHGGEVTFGLNKFADMTPLEFRTTMLMPSRAPPRHPPNRYMKVDTTTIPLPDSFDWTTKGVVTPVKDQGDAGTCWAFSTVGNLEGLWAIQGKPLTNFSVEQIVDCDGTQDQKDDKADCGVFGGWPFLAYQYIERAGGLQSWEDYWYCSGLGGLNGTCVPCAAPGYNRTLCGPPVPYCLKNESCAAKINPSKFVPGMKVVDWKAISENETEMAAALMATGPLSVALDATMLQFYRRGVFAPVVGCSKTSLNHAVLVVGWGVANGLLEKKPYWKVKNSWGRKWGLHGYFLIKRGVGECGINTLVTSGVLQKA